MTKSIRVSSCYCQAEERMSFYLRKPPNPAMKLIQTSLGAYFANKFQGLGKCTTANSASTPLLLTELDLFDMGLLLAIS